MPATPYATLTDLTNSINATALNDSPVSVQQAQLQRAADYMDSKLNTQYQLPLVQWQTDMVDCNCALAVYGCLRARGWNPKTGGNKEVVESREFWLNWLEQIAEGKAHPVVTDSSATTGSPPPGAAGVSGFEFSAGSPANLYQNGGMDNGQTRGWK